MRTLKYSDAIAEATLQAMEDDPKLFVMGEGVDDAKGAFGTTLLAFQRYGSQRVMDTPLSESAMTGIGIGAAIAGHPCIMVHLRNEFLCLAMDQVINHAAKWHYMFAGKFKVPVVFRCIVGRGWGQAAQHSQSLHGLFAQIPGLKVVLPSNAYDAKGLLLAAIRDPNPVVFIEHRWLHDKAADVPEQRYEIALGKAQIVAEGEHATCVAVSYSVLDALKARAELLTSGISLEVIDARTVRPLDKATILASVAKTGRLVICDTAPGSGGISAEIAAVVAEEGFASLKAPIRRIGLPEVPTPCSAPLEESYYPSAGDIHEVVKKFFSSDKIKKIQEKSDNSQFFGPF